MRFPTPPPPARASTSRNLINLQSDEEPRTFLPVKDFVPDQYIVMVTKHGVIKKIGADRVRQSRCRAASSPLYAGRRRRTDRRQASPTATTTSSWARTKARPSASREKPGARHGPAGARRARHGPGRGRLPGGHGGGRKGRPASCRSRENGYGKRTPLEDYRLTKRGGKGVINMKTTNKTGQRGGASCSVKEDSDMMIVSQNGKMIRIESSTIRQAGRSTQGVRLVNLDEGDKVAAASVLPEAEEAPTTVRRRFRFSKLYGWGDPPTAMPTLVDLTLRSGIEEKERKLFANLSAMGRVIVAFSGGTDSAYLAWAANRALGDNALAITADSASMPESHKRDAEAFVARFGIAHEYVETREFDNPDYAAQQSRPLLPLQGRTVHAAGSGGARARLRAHRLRRESGRPGRLPARTGRRRPAPGGRAAGRCRAHQGRDPRALAAGRSAHVGPSRIGVPEFPHSVRDSGDDSRT